MTANSQGGGGQTLPTPPVALKLCHLVALRNLSIPAYRTCRLVALSLRLQNLSNVTMFHNVFNLILENLSLRTPPVALSLCRLVCKINPIHSAHDSLIDRFRLRSFSIAVLLIHIDKIRGKR